MNTFHDSLNYDKNLTRTPKMKFFMSNRYAESKSIYDLLYINKSVNNTLKTVTNTQAFKKYHIILKDKFMRKKCVLQSY